MLDCCQEQVTVGVDGNMVYVQFIRDNFNSLKLKKCHKLRVTPAKDTYVIKVLCAINSNYSSRIELCICCSKNLWLWTVEKKILTTPKIELLSFFSVFVFLPERQIYPALQHVPTAHESVNGPLRTAFKFWQVFFSKPPITTRKPINTPFTPWSQVYTPHLHITKILSVSSTSGARNGSSETGLLIGRKQATRNKPYKKTFSSSTSVLSTHCCYLYF